MYDPAAMKEYWEIDSYCYGDYSVFMEKTAYSFWKDRIEKLASERGIQISWTHSKSKRHYYLPEGDYLPDRTNHDFTALCQECIHFSHTHMKYGTASGEWNIELVPIKEEKIRQLIEAAADHPELKAALQRYSNEMAIPDWSLSMPDF